MAEDERELTREEQGLDPEPQDGPGDLEDLPEEDFDSYAEDDVEVADAPPTPATDTAPPEQSSSDATSLDQPDVDTTADDGGENE